MTGWWGAPVEGFYRYLVCKAIVYSACAPVAALWSWEAPVILLFCALCAVMTAAAIRRFAGETER